MVSATTSNCFAFLPASDARGMQKMTLTNPRSGLSMSFSVQNNLFVQDLGIVVGQKRNQWGKMVWTPTARTPDEKAWRQTFKSKINVWTNKLRESLATLDADATKFSALFHKAMNTDDFHTVNSYCREWQKMLFHAENWKNGCGVLWALSSTNSSLATSKALNAFQEQVKAISDLFIHQLGNLTIVYTFEPIEIYAEKLLRRQNDPITSKEFAWAEEQYLQLKPLKVPTDPLFSMHTRLDSARQSLEKVIERQPKN